MNRLEERLREINTYLTLELHPRDRQKLEKEKKEILQEFIKQWEGI